MSSQAQKALLRDVQLSDETNFHKQVLKKNQIDNYYVPGRRTFYRFLCLAGGRKVPESKLTVNHQRHQRNFFVVNYKVAVSSRANEINHSTNCCLKHFDS